LNAGQARFAWVSWRSTGLCLRAWSRKRIPCVVTFEANWLPAPARDAVMIFHRLAAEAARLRTVVRNVAMVVRGLVAATLLLVLECSAASVSPARSPDCLASAPAPLAAAVAWNVAQAPASLTAESEPAPLNQRDHQGLPGRIPGARAPLRAL